MRQKLTGAGEKKGGKVVFTDLYLLDGIFLGIS
mgnify:CR=1 FL=1|jgi:hypothetical protein